MKVRFCVPVVGALVTLVALGLLATQDAAALQADTPRSETAVPIEGWDTMSGEMTTSPIPVSFSILGLPIGLKASVFVDSPASGGGFIRVRRVATDATTASLGPGEFLEASPIPVGDAERYLPVRRFQQAAAGFVVFVYQREFLVIVSRWSHGPNDPTSLTKVHGSTSTDSRWMPAGSTLVVTATPDPGYGFAQWGVFDLGETADEVRASSHSPQLRVVVDHPIHVVAGFMSK